VDEAASVLALHAHLGNTKAGGWADGLVRHVGLSDVSADQLRTAMSMTDIAAG
jgi:hypothetical protein